MSLAWSFLVNEGERAEHEDPTIQTCKANDPEAIIQDRHTHTRYGLKIKDLPEDAKEEQKADIKSANKLQRGTSGNPWEKPSKNKNTVK